MPDVVNGPAAYHADIDRPATSPQANFLQPICSHLNVLTISSPDWVIAQTIYRLVLSLNLALMHYLVTLVQSPRNIAPGLDDKVKKKRRSRSITKATEYGWSSLLKKHDRARDASDDLDCR